MKFGESRRSSLAFSSDAFHMYTYTHAPLEESACLMYSGAGWRIKSLLHARAAEPPWATHMCVCVQIALRRVALCRRRLRRQHLHNMQRVTSESALQEIDVKGYAAKVRARNEELKFQVEFTFTRPVFSPQRMKM